MLRHLKLYVAFVRICAMREMESRGSFVVGCLVIFAFPIFPLLFMSAIFGQSANFKGWTFNEYLVLAGTFQCVSGIVFAMFSKNIFGITEYVRKGELDFFLLKPVNSQFMLTTRYFSFNELSQIVPGVIMVWIGLANSHLNPDWWRWLLYPFFVGCGVVIAYSVWFMIALPTIWWVKLEAPEMFFGLFDVARYHPTMFGGVVRSLLLFVVPLGVIASTPADLLLGRLGWGAAAWAIALAVILLFLSNRFWHFAQSHYYGASS